MLNTLEMLRDSSLLVVLRCADVVVGRRVIDFGRRCCFAAVLFVVRILILFPNRQVIDSARRRRFAAVLFVVGILILFPDRWGIGSGRRRCFAAVLFVVGILLWFLNSRYCLCDYFISRQVQRTGPRAGRFLVRVV